MNNFIPLKGFEDTHYINEITLEVYSILKKRILKGSINNRLHNLSLKKQRRQNNNKKTTQISS